MLQKLYAAAVRNVVKDDAFGASTFSPAANPGARDISATPNRMLQSYVLGQADLDPSVISVDSSQKATRVKVGAKGAGLEQQLPFTGGPGVCQQPSPSAPCRLIQACGVPVGSRSCRLMSLPPSPQPCLLSPQVSLAFRPSANVTVKVKVPFAWNGRLLADVYPERMTFAPHKHDWYQMLTIQPASVSTGNYFIEVGALGACCRAKDRAAAKLQSETRAGSSTAAASVAPLTLLLAVPLVVRAGSAPSQLNQPRLRPCPRSPSACPSPPPPRYPGCTPAAVPAKQRQQLRGCPAHHPRAGPSPPDGRGRRQRARCHPAALQGLWRQLGLQGQLRRRALRTRWRA
jgi:hypothetical protein